MGRAGLAWKLRPQDLNLEVGGSYDVCSIFQVFFPAGRREFKKNFDWKFDFGGGFGGKLGTPQDLNLEVGWSYNVCSIFRVFFSAGRS